MPLLSVITAVHCDRGEYLEEAAQSLAAQPMPAGWELEWLIQEDGFNPQLDTAHLALRSHHHATRRQLGPASTRSVALHRSRGDLVVCLDEDDAYFPEGLTTLIEVLAAAPTEQAWVCGGFHTFDETGFLGESTMPLLPEGNVGIGEVAQYWEKHNRFPFLATQVMYRRPMLIEAGGWPSVPRSEDAALLALVNARHAGLSLHRATLRYRKHAAQNTAQSWAEPNKELARQMALTYARSVPPLP